VPSTVDAPALATASIIGERFDYITFRSV